MGKFTNHRCIERIDADTLTVQETDLIYCGNVGIYSTFWSLYKVAKHKSLTYYDAI